VDPFGDDCFEVSDEQYTALMDQIATGFFYLDTTEDGQPTVKEYTPPPLDIKQVYQSKSAGLTNSFESAVQAARGPYPQAEAITWALQLAEAQTYDAWRKAGKEGDAPVTPYITLLNNDRTAEGVGNGFDDLVDGILENNGAFAPVMTKLTAKRQAAQKAIEVAYAADDLKALSAVSWNFSLGEGL